MYLDQQLSFSSAYPASNSLALGSNRNFQKSTGMVLRPWEKHCSSSLLWKNGMKRNGWAIKAEKLWSTTSYASSEPCCSPCLIRSLVSVTWERDDFCYGHAWSVVVFIQPCEKVTYAQPNPVDNSPNLKDFCQFRAAFWSSVLPFTAWLRVLLILALQRLGRVVAWPFKDPVLHRRTSFCSFCSRKHGSEVACCVVARSFSRFIDHSLLFVPFFHSRQEEQCFSQGWKAIPIHFGKFWLLSSAKILLGRQIQENGIRWSERCDDVSRSILSVILSVGLNQISLKVLSFIQAGRA